MSFGPIPEIKVRPRPTRNAVQQSNLLAPNYFGRRNSTPIHFSARQTTVHCLLTFPPFERTKVIWSGISSVEASLSCAPVSEISDIAHVFTNALFDPIIRAGWRRVRRGAFRFSASINAPEIHSYSSPEAVRFRHRLTPSPTSP